MRKTGLISGAGSYFPRQTGSIFIINRNWGSIFDFCHTLFQGQPDVTAPILENIIAIIILQAGRFIENLFDIPLDGCGAEYKMFGNLFV